MKKLLYIIIATGILSSCNDRDKFFDELNEAPEIGLFSSAGVVKTASDSIKISLKSQKKFKVYDFNLSDKDGNAESVTFKFNQGGAVVKQNGVSLSGDIDISQEYFELIVYPDAVGRNELELTAIDKAGSSSKITLEIIAFNNVPPVAKYVATNIAVKSPLEYRIDASASYDRDEKIGGGIELYKYTINGVEINSKLDNIKWIFDKAGVYTVKLDVQDSDGVWSNTYSTDINVN